MSATQASLKKNEGYVYKNLFDKQKKTKPKYEKGDLVRTADLKKTFSKGDTTNSSYNLYKISAIINDTIPNCRIDNLPERYKESLLKKTDFSMKQIDNVMKKLKIDIV